ncbi:Hypothetical protein GLP15_1326 [Giardia lamblia P15]|uniref:Uncharacterized protein n=1 Tax=Giardia intestinalis (strain P15) TaxID=658858 RepID=E1F879_GIAIA|nr:Hypothetical protein GLP15_1326 [Giardia lamblia P15]
MLSSTSHDPVTRNIPSTTLKKTMNTVDLHPRAGKSTGPVDAYHSHINAIHIVPSDPSYAATGHIHEYGDYTRVKAPELSKASLVTTMYPDPIKYSQLDAPPIKEYKVSSFYDAFPRDKASIALTRRSSGYGKFGGAPYNNYETGSSVSGAGGTQTKSYRRSSVDSVNRLLASQYTLGSTAGSFRDGCLSESALRNYSSIKCYPTTMESYSTGRVNTLAGRRFSEQTYTGLDLHNYNSAAFFKNTAYTRGSPFSGTAGPIIA